MRRRRWLTLFRLRVIAVHALPIVLALALLACRKVVESTGTSILLQLSLPAQVPDLPNGRLSVTIDELAESPSLFSASIPIAAGRTGDGISFETEVLDADADGRYEFQLRTLVNPFLLGGNPWTFFIASGSVSVKFQIVAQLVDNGVVVASATATRDTNAEEIRFGPSQRTVNLPLACGAGGCGAADAGTSDAGADAGSDAGPIGNADAGSLCSTDNECGYGKYCNLDNPRRCTACSLTDRTYCGTASSPPGCVECPPTTPTCVAGACACTEHTSCGSGKYCGPIDAGVPDGGQTLGCPDGNLGSAIGNSVATGTTQDAGDRTRNSCSASSGTAPDRLFGWRAPTTGTYTFDTMGASFDSTLALRDGGCSAPELNFACNDQGGTGYGNASKVTVSLQEGQPVGIVIDGYYTYSAGSFTLNINYGTAGSIGGDAGGVDAGVAGACYACSQTDPKLCGIASTAAGCDRCDGGTPYCMGGVCSCTNDEPCGVGKYCTSSTGGQCASCSSSDPGFCGSSTSDAGCTYCTGSTPFCVGGLCKCTSHASCGTGKYCLSIDGDGGILEGDGGVCRDCVSTDALHCGTWLSAAGCAVCGAATPVCQGGACSCTSHGTCGTGSYCSNLDGGQCFSCVVDAPLHCGTQFTAAGCFQCTAGTSSCAGGGCLCTGSGATDTCIAADGRICNAGACTACVSGSQCAPGQCCSWHTDRCRPRTMMWGGLVSPHGRKEHSAIYDSLNKRMIAFGGRDEPSSQNDTWALSLAQVDAGQAVWTYLATKGTPPSIREKHSAVYDSVNARMIVFGGYQYSSGAYLQDVWALSLPLNGTPTWMQLSPTALPDAGLPQGRSNHTAVFDPLNRQMIVFGGYRSSSYQVGDTWALSLPDAGSPVWAQLSSTGAPSLREGAMGIYDNTPANPRMVLFGGYAYTGTWVYYNDTYALSLSPGGSPAWSSIVVTGGPPAVRYDHAFIYDSQNQRAVLFGGYVNSSPYKYGDVWQLALSAVPAVWSQPTTVGSPPVGRRSHAAVYDNVNQRMIVFGGGDPDTPTNDSAEVWSLSISTGTTFTWSLLSPGAGTPGLLYNHSAVWDSANAQMVVFGGYDYSSYRNETWVLRAPTNTSASWTQLATSPSPPPTLNKHSAIYDPLFSRMIVFGGEGQNATNNDTWALSLVDAGTAEWEKLTPSGTLPAARYGHSAVYDGHYQRMVVFGGYSYSSSYLTDGWVMSLPAGGGVPEWTNKTPGGASPSARRDHSAVYDSRYQRMIVFGGTGSLTYNDVWSLSLPPTASAFGWTQIFPDGGPPATRYGHAAVYDDVNQRMIVFGGSSKNDSWAITLPAGPPYVWTNLTPDAGVLPTGRSDHTAVWDVAGGRMITFGGYGSTGRNDVWVLFPEQCL